MKLNFLTFSSFLVIILPLVILIMARSVNAQSVPTIISHQGRLLNSSNQPVTTAVNVQFAIFDAASGGNQVWTETQSITPDNLGFYDTFLGGVTALPATLPNPSYLQITVQSETLSPRLQFGSVPFAQKAGSMQWAGLTSFPTSCTSGQFVSAVGSTLTCSSPTTGISGSGTTNYLAKFTGSTSIGNPVNSIVDTGTGVGIGTTDPSGLLHVAGNINIPLGSYYYFNPGDTNWRTGLTSSGHPFTTSLVTDNRLNIVIPNASNQGFAIGQQGGSSIFELRGDTKTAYFPGNVGIGT